MAVAAKSMAKTFKSFSVNSVIKEFAIHHGQPGAILIESWLRRLIDEPQGDPSQGDPAAVVGKVVLLVPRIELHPACHRRACRSQFQGHGSAYPTGNAGHKRDSGTITRWLAVLHPAMT